MDSTTIFIVTGPDGKLNLGITEGQSDYGDVNIHIQHQLGTINGGVLNSLREDLQFVLDHFDSLFSSENCQRAHAQAIEERELKLRSEQEKRLRNALLSPPVNSAYG